MFYHNLRRMGLIFGVLILLSSCSTKEQSKLTKEENSNKAVSPANPVREYIINDSNKVLLSADNVSNMDSHIMELARNEIYARHGYIFKRKDLADYFSSKKWYKKNQNYKDAFTDIEKKNIELLHTYEAKYAAYQLIATHTDDYRVKNYEGSNTFKQQHMVIDLNGDGISDNVELKIPTTKGDTTWTLKVNGTSLQFDGEDKFPYFEIVDLNINDPYFEIAFQFDSQYDFFRETYFYYYDGQKIRSVGTVPDFAAHSSMIDGFGTVKGIDRAKELQTWYRELVFRLDAEHQLREEEQDFYSMSPPTVLTAKKELKLQKLRNSDEEYLQINPGDQVSFLGEDNRGYIKFELSTGLTGWFQAGDMYDFTDYFEGLILYD
ncbi:YARHG domain-containing protein [Paenibacillus sp. IHBB 3054]|uniref:YARHG domain-containing protein n=1 Tax=Paenibacillus sp. IHBB 3054 TaxID=3425689 RepID=UPI003F66D5DC